MPKYTLYAKKIHYYRKDIEAKNDKAAQQRAERYEKPDSFTYVDEEFYVSSIEENEDGSDS
jgi:hypothetical protein|tara:strand:- start:1387 stop:1569 length:183 start_codon:yes stop_codon:yes gene_type:complete